MIRRILIISAILMIVHLQYVDAQSFRLFSQKVKSDYPSVVYDFLERYLYELDSLQRKGIDIQQKIIDDKVVFIKGSVTTANKITVDMGVKIDLLEGKMYQVSWLNASGEVVLGICFPMQYELILGKPKNVIEKELKSEIMKSSEYTITDYTDADFEILEDGCYTPKYNSNYYLESLNTATYYIKTSTDKYSPTFNDDDKWHSAANLLQGCISDISRYTLFIKQNLYGFKYDSFSVPLAKWIGYCQKMKMTTYFAVEEEREDGIKALVIAQNPYLGFNHILSLIIPHNFVKSKRCVLKATLNAYVPTQNVKELYQQYVNKPKKSYE